MERCVNYRLLAELFKYPTVKLIDRAVECQNILKKNNPEAAQELEKFIDFLFDTPMHKIEEVYADSPHVHAIPFLNYSYANYRKKRIMLDLDLINGEIEDFNFSNHLINVLSKLPAFDKKNCIRELTEGFIIPSILRILNDFETKKQLNAQRIKYSNKVFLPFGIRYSAAYQYAFKALLLTFEGRFRIKVSSGEIDPSFFVNPLISNENGDFRQLGFQAFLMSGN